MAASTATHATEAARRYASALFELAKDKAQLEAVHADLGALTTLIRESDDFKRLIASPAFAREDKVKAITAIVEKAGLGELVRKFAGAMAANGRASDLPGAGAAFDALYASQRGVKRAVARTAKPMDEAQRDRVRGLLAKAVGGDVDLSEEVDPALIGGIQLRIGSQLIDASLATKLDRMNTAMKGA